MTRMYRPRPTPCGREQETGGAQENGMFHVKRSGGGDGAPCGGDLRGDGALCAVAQRRPNGKKHSNSESRAVFSRRRKAERWQNAWFVENHAPTSRIVQPYEAGTPSEFDAFLPSQPYSVPRKGNRDRRSSRAFDDVRWIGHVRAGARTGGAARRRAPGVHEPRHHCRADRRSRAGRAPGVQVVGGIEVSAYDFERGRKVHILGLGVEEGAPRAGRPCAGPRLSAVTRTRCGSWTGWWKRATRWT